MDTKSIRELIDGGRYDDALHQALTIAESGKTPETRAHSLLLAAECAAKTGDADEADRLLTWALQVAPAGSDELHRAMLNLGKIHLRRNEIALAERVFLEALGRHKGKGVLTARASFGLGQVYEAQRRWGLAAGTYNEAAKGYAAAHDWGRFIGAQQNQAWALMMDSRADLAAYPLGAFENYSTHATERQRHNQEALAAYHAYLLGKTETAANLTAELVTSGGPSAWANCLVAVTAGLLAHQSGMTAEAQKALKLAESVMLQASHETGSTDIINLVNELRNRAA